MKRKLILVTIAILNLPCYSQRWDITPSIKWSINLGKNGDNGMSVCHASDGNFVMMCKSANMNIRLVKVNPAGEIIWDKVLINGGSCRGLIETRDRGFIIVGNTEAVNLDCDLLILKTNDQGDLLWVKTYGSTITDIGYNACETADGGLVVVGNAYASQSSPGSVVWLLKTDAVGQKLWERNFGFGGTNQGFAVKETL
jgi:hypothetical protein